MGVSLGRRRATGTWWQAPFCSPHVLSPKTRGAIPFFGIGPHLFLKILSAFTLPPDCLTLRFNYLCKMDFFCPSLKSGIFNWDCFCSPGTHGNMRRQLWLSQPGLGAGGGAGRSWLLVSWSKGRVTPPTRQSQPSMTRYYLFNINGSEIEKPWLSQRLFLDSLSLFSLSCILWVISSTTTKKSSSLWWLTQLYLQLAFSFEHQTCVSTILSGFFHLLSYKGPFCFHCWAFWGSRKIIVHNRKSSLWL